ncbi:uncharacterized protein LOC114828061 [Galendromus occidentalis]|uniref:Uncharacterized protein LOC114828061 n=1 Tax=Galendromus occidentalis TaxID=34638 RepID=A0AAJ7SED8_9ACAR|nr:uncharacterized protein LOC114828061 [Galendromus occidentalis]
MADSDADRKASEKSLFKSVMISLRHAAPWTSPVPSRNLPVQEGVAVNAATLYKFILLPSLHFAVGIPSDKSCRSVLDRSRCFRMFRAVLLIAYLTAVSAAQVGLQRVPVAQTLDMLRSANDVFTRVARFGGGGIAIFLPVLLCIGFFAFIIPFAALLVLGTTSFSGGSPGWGGSAGLYPAGRHLAEMIPGLPLSNDQLVQAMTLLDKAFTQFSSTKTPPSAPANKLPAKERTQAAKSLDQGYDSSSSQATPTLPEPESLVALKT